MITLRPFVACCAALVTSGVILFPSAVFAVAGPGNNNAPLTQTALSNPCAGGPKSVGFTLYNTPKPPPGNMAPAPPHSGGGGPGNNVAIMPAPNVSSKPPPTPVPAMPTGCAFLAMKSQAGYGKMCSDYSLAVIRHGAIISSSFLTNASNGECDYIFQTSVPVNEPLDVTIMKTGQKQTLPPVTIPSSYAGKTTPPFYTQSFSLPF